MPTTVVFQHSMPYNMLTYITISTDIVYLCITRNFRHDLILNIFYGLNAFVIR